MFRENATSSEIHLNLNLFQVSIIGNNQNKEILKQVKKDDFILIVMLNM